jgi:hypothetical protein
MGDQPYRKTCPDLPDPADAPKVAALLPPPDAGKAPSAESAPAPTEAPGPAVTAPPIIPPQPEKPKAPAPVQEGAPVKPVDAEDRARIGLRQCNPCSLFRQRREIGKSLLRALRVLKEGQKLRNRGGPQE